MKMKRVISLLLTLVLLTGSVPGAVFAEETQTTEETTVPAEETEETEASDEEEETEPSEPSEPEEEPEVVHEHDYEAVVTDPTCTEQGYTTYTCQCGESYVDAYVDAKGHDYENGICTGCGAESSGAALWRGKSAVFVGDSITAGTGTTRIYYQYLEEMIGFGSVTAMGVGGSCISTASDYGQSNQPLINRYQQIPSADLIVIFMGTNDYGHETPLGSVEDTQDGTFYGALNTIVPALVAKHPSSKIVFVTPLHRYGFGSSKILGTKFTYDHIPNGVGATLKDYVDAIKMVCTKNSVSVIDLYTECTLDPTDSAVRSGFIPDGLHPNAAGHELFAGIMESYIGSYKPVEKAPETEAEPEEKNELVYGNKFAAGFDQKNRASARVNQHFKAGTVITLKDPENFQWSCAKTTGENSSTNLGYFPDSQWTDKETAVVESDGWVGFVFKYRDESKVFDLTKPLSDYVTIEVPHAHEYASKVTESSCSEKGYTTYTCICGDSYVDDYVEATGHKCENGVCAVCGYSFAGKKASILSHSMSTYDGVSNNTAYNSTIGKNDVYYTEGRHDVYREDTWWQQTIDALGMELLVNNSWSGSCVFQPRKGAASVGYGNRAVNLHNDRTGEAPDVIFVYLGCNDFAYYQDSFGKAAEVDYAGLIRENGDGTYTYGTPTTTCEAYAIMLHKVEHRYPDAEIYCMTSTARRETDYTGDSYPDAGQPTAYSAELQKVAKYFGYPVADLENAIPKDVEIFDKYMGDKRAHANKLGMDQITNEVLTVMQGKETEICHVICQDGTVKEQAVLRGGAYSAQVQLREDESVAVTMGGKDITDEACRNGKITISKITGDIVVEKVIDREPLDFAWEIQNNVLVSVGSADNTATKLDGTVTDGMLNNARYQLETAVVLKHDLPWALEWQCEGDWRGCVFAEDPGKNSQGKYYLTRTVGGQLSFGFWTGKQYDNYGVDLSQLDDQLHTYRLENRIGSDGSNRVWVYVDGKEVGQMNRYYIGSKDQSKESDWVSGKDFLFPYISMDGHALRNCRLAYLKVFECVHDYKEGICTLCGEAAPSMEGKTISILGASISTYQGTSNGAAANTTNSTIGSNAKYYPSTVVTDVGLNDTWWMQAANDLGLRLLVNNSWSGSSLLHERSGTVGAYVDRCVQLHDDTGDNAGEVPDIIAVQMGTNDFQYYKDTLGTADIDYETLIVDNGDGTYNYSTPVTSLEAAAIVLHKISVRYPNAEVYYLNISQRVDGTDELIQSFNGELKQVVEHFDAHIVDIYGSAITMADFDTYIGDGRVHPNKLGMDAYTEAFKRSVVANTNYQIDTHIVSLELDDVTADYGDDKIVVSGNAFSINLTAMDSLDVTVTMGGKDITNSVYADGTVIIDAVTADVTITAASVHEPQNYRWEFNGSDLACVKGNNALTKNGGTTAVGVFSKTRYTLESAVLLTHDQPWVVEWKCQGTFLNSGSSTGARIFTSDAVNANYNARYIFKSNNKGIIAMGEKTTTGSHNYGIALADYDIDWTALHTYRLENRIADDGSNMVYLFVDGAEIGPMNHYYVGTTDKKTTSDWLSGKDFTFPYMGTDTHGFTNCSIEYIAVCESSETATPLSLRYDDRYDVRGKVVEIIDAGQPTSYQVGYGVEENKVPDTAVVSVRGNDLVATGIGTAKVRIDGQLYEVTVTAAPISLLLLIGQSNMEGNEGEAKQSIVCPDGQVYATYGDRYDMTLENATHYTPSALTGAYRTVNAVGGTDGLADYPVYMLTDEGSGRKGPDSGFAYEWVRQTGEKIWIVNASHGGTSLNVWQPGTTQYEECQAMFGACAETLRKEIAAGHFTLNHMAYFWCQGCNDWDKTAQWYVTNYLTMHKSLKEELAFDHDSNGATADKTFEFGGIIPVRSGHDWRTYYREGVYTDTTDKSYYESFKDLQMSGPRVAQYWMGNNPELTDIWNVCTIGEDWVWMPDGTNGVSAYFQDHYQGGKVDYETQVKQKDAWYTPTTPADVHDSIHYNQIGYNEVGREAVRNALIYMGVNPDCPEETTVQFVDWTGYRQVDEIHASEKAHSGTLVVPIVSPITRCKEVSYRVSQGLYYDWYDLTADGFDTVGVLEAVGAEGSVAVVKQKPGALYADHLSSLPEKVCVGTNLWTALEHDSLYYTVDGWGSHSSGKVYSVTIPAKEGDKIWATSMGANGANGNTISTGHGIRVTFFGEYGVIVSKTSAEVYQEFSKNGYLTAPEGTTAVNVPMWNGDDSNELYVLNLPHDTDDGICGICGKNSHVHSWSAWKTVKIPTEEEMGQEQRVCGCGETESREVPGVWQTHDLGTYLLDLPENCCPGMNLWNELPHTQTYYYGGTHWGTNTGANVWAVTIPVKAGDQIYATAFEAAGKNGYTSSGIRCTFFDAYGVAKTLSPAETYAEFSKNGYLTAPEGAIAVNVPMYGNSNSYELYILNREHCYGDWEITREVTADSEGREQKVCAGCGDVKVRRIVPVALTATVEPVKVSKGAKPEDVKIGLSASQTIGGAVADLEMEYIITDKDGKEVTLEEALKQPGEYTIIPKVKTP